MISAEPYGTTTIWPRPIYVVPVQYSLGPYGTGTIHASAEPCGTGTINTLANVGWPMWIGPLSSQVARVVWNNSTERCVRIQ
jgi:hypothetical protein